MQFDDGLGECNYFLLKLLVQNLKLFLQHSCVSIIIGLSSRAVNALNSHLKASACSVPPKIHTAFFSSSSATCPPKSSILLVAHPVTQTSTQDIDIDIIKPEYEEDESFSLFEKVSSYIESLCWYLLGRLWDSLKILFKIAPIP